ncbi:MAG: two component system response [Desulfobulbaceae bacterium]|nr:MAG: two component system response [Desulfobulbaceae bacterium]
MSVLNVQPPIRLVIAEDDFLVCEEIKRILRDSAYEVVGEAGNGKQAIRMVSELRPDVVLMDIKMPEMDGLEASRRITAECPTPIVIMTAYETADLLETASQAGVASFLTKPPQLADINRAIPIAMARHTDLMELRRVNRELQTALDEIKTLRGILPMCSYCHKIRTEDDSWVDVATYIYKNTEADVSHGICPDCLKEQFPKVFASLVIE